MRNPERISPMLGKIELFWQRHPDLRLGQVISIIENQVKADGYGSVFYIEDEDMDKVLDEVASAF